jgi:hypothetical protein
MIIRALATSGANLPPTAYEAGYTSKSVFHVSVNKRYRVHGVALVAGTLCYLVEDDTGLPSWVPAALCEILDATVPEGWAFTFYHPPARYPGMIEALLSYSEIVHEESFPDALMNRHPEVLARFRKLIQDSRSTD